MNKTDNNIANTSEIINEQNTVAGLPDSLISHTDSKETGSSCMPSMEIMQDKIKLGNQDGGPLVSVIVRSMDRSTLSEALDSVASQTYPNIEVVLVNAKGEKHSPIGEHCGNFPLRLIDTGARLTRSRAANKGLDAAQGDYLIFLDDDDWFMPEHIDKLVSALEARRDIVVAYSGVVCVDENKNPLPDRFAKPYDAIQLLSTNYIPIHSALFSKILLEKGCRVDESLDLYEDWDFWIQASQISDFVFVDRFSAIYRISSQSGFGVNFDQNKAIQSSLIVYEKWFPKLKGEKLLDIAHLVRCYDVDQRTIKELYDTIGKRDTQINELNTSIGELNTSIGELNTSIGELNTSIGEKESCLTALSDELKATKDELKATKDELKATKEELEQVYNSRSWKITRPLRDIRTIWLSDRSIILCTVRKLWLMLPISIEKKTLLKRWLVGEFPILSRHRVDSDDELSNDSTWLDGQNETSDYSIPSFELAYRNRLETALNVKPTDFVPLSDDPTDLSSSKIKLIAFYLPQFHPIPENDREWGKGFTEWTNVSKAVPQFVGHYQPRLPGELGFYDLRIKEVQKRQIELAKQYGIQGFCYHHYWFDGHKVLDGPFQQVLADSSLDLPFCLCWANENWTRRWDGGEDEIILAQKHSPEDDLAFIKDKEPAFRDARYIRIDGKPLLIVYRPELLPDPKATAQRWRNYMVSVGIGDLFLVAAATFGLEDYQSIGYDGLVQFPPHNIGAHEITQRVQLLNNNYRGHVYDYADYVSQALKSLRGKQHTFPCVMMDWDNEARKPGKGHTFLGCSPQKYKNWLMKAMDFAGKNPEDERLVFINAWNEWAEGTYLEPDRRYGYAYLHATREALKTRIAGNSSRKIILVSHDGHPMGAQYLVLHLAKLLKNEFKFDVAIVVLNQGILLPEYASVAKLYDLSGQNHKGKAAVKLARELFEQGYRAALVNTTVSGLFLEKLADAGMRCVALIHEMPGIIDAYRLHDHAHVIAEKASAVIFPTVGVAEAFPCITNIAAERIHIRPQGLYKRNAFKNSKSRARMLLRKELGLLESDKIVLGVGYADYRKGIDLFVEIGLQLSVKRTDVYFVWLGHWDDAMERQIQKRLSGEPNAHHLMFPGRRDDTDLFYAGADIYALTSREDPFPSVTMESLNVAVPVIGFGEASGSEELLKQGCGVLVAKEDCVQFAKAIEDLLNDSQKLAQLGTQGAELIENSFSFRHYLFDLLDIAGFGLKRVSVVVPNYNYARYLPKRLASILNQSYPLFELLVLDDASTDDSLEVIETYMKKSSTEYQVIKNDENSCSVFKQWRKAVEIARGDLIWIAEADDEAAPTFLEKSVALFDDERLVMTYSQSQQIDENGARLNDHYLDYTDDIDRHKWRRNYINDGTQELASALAVKNTIPNVSAAVFRKSALQSAFVQCGRLLSRLNIAGDWLVYSELLLNGKIGYINESLNSHRRHQKSVTVSSSSHSRHLAEIIFMQNYVGARTTLDSAVKTKAEQYVDKVYRQFELHNEGIANPADHELVRAALLSIESDEQSGDSA